ncbi:hypothetical protein [Jeotgalicoccus sp. FSL K6-3177]|uniref:hypothetical protein n=1 Tax=Jeotgalicoccus sp. FSL K6-3177 TaxID=2921494 RepID=UPI0030FD4E9C
MKKLCEECNQFKDELPFLYDYNDENMNVIEERKTCEDCWRALRFKVRVISHGPMIKRNGAQYKGVTVVGKPISGQLELF